MPDFLGHAENPLREDEWARLNETVIQVARRSLVGRRILDIYGPLGAGACGINPRRLRFVAGRDARYVCRTPDPGETPR